MNNNINTKQNPYNLITTRNYASQHIYNIIFLRHPDYDKKQIQLKIQSIFKELVNNIRHISTTNELDIFNTPMSTTPEGRQIIFSMVNVSKIHPPQKQVLKDILHHFEDFQILTIDKFNLRLIRSFSKELK